MEAGTQLAGQPSNQPTLTPSREGIVLPSSYTDGPYRIQLVAEIRNRPDFFKANDAVVAFEVLLRLGYREELITQLNTKSAALRATDQLYDLKKLGEETAKAKQEILDSLYPDWKKLVQLN
jgi:hypothetical protein